MSDTGVAPERRRITAWKGVRLLFASLVAVAVGLFGLAMWAPNIMTFGPVMDGRDLGWAFRAVMLVMFAGPFAAGAGLLVGWITFFFRPVTGIRIVIIPPLLWGLSVLAIFANALGRCDGDWVC
ncbi:hypothetical protein [Hyphobacterium indicum]|uniref:hypothetical protein n=1 Tax=Hyphobacterium indicum TaxID=2162714 RepID=UPI000D64CE3F|nr:hypothetical protein [Hyphobacterium indicum]